MDFFVRDADSVVPIEVKATNNATASLNNLIEKEMYPEIKYGIKFCEKNIGLTVNSIRFRISWCSCSIAI